MTTPHSQNSNDTNSFPGAAADDHAAGTPHADNTAGAPQNGNTAGAPNAGGSAEDAITMATQLSNEEFLEKLVARLESHEVHLKMAQAFDFVDDPNDEPLLPFAGDINCRLVLNFPENIVPLTSKSVAGRGDLQDLFAQGITNLITELAEIEVSVEKIENPDNPDLIMWALESNNTLLSSFPLVLGNFLAKHIPEANVDEGVLVGLPTNNAAIVAPVTSGSELLNTIQHAANAVVSVFSDSSHRLSPSLNLGWQDEFTPVTQLAQNEDGELALQFTPNEYLQQKLS